MKRILTIVSFLVLSISMHSQNIAGSREYIEALTAQWNGERFEDGRPKVSDDLLERLRNYEGNLPMSKEQLEAYIKERNF